MARPRYKGGHGGTISGRGQDFGGGQDSFRPGADNGTDTGTDKGTDKGTDNYGADHGADYAADNGADHGTDYHGTDYGTDYGADYDTDYNGTDHGSVIGSDCGWIFGLEHQGPFTGLAIDRILVRRQGTFLERSVSHMNEKICVLYSFITNTIIDRNSQPWLQLIIFIRRATRV